jgi:hypothetical protein
MNCTEARDAMLVAELAELRARDASTPLSTHLADCSACRARAASIANQTAYMGALVAERRGTAHRIRPIRRFVFIASLPVAAALIVAVVLNLRPRATVAPETASASRPVVRNVSVDVAPGQQTTVLKTADSTVTVIWLTPGVGQ